jgi:hypothetical protein
MMSHQRCRVGWYLLGYHKPVCCQGSSRADNTVRSAGCCCALYTAYTLTPWWWCRRRIIYAAHVLQCLSTTMREQVYHCPRMNTQRIDPALPHAPACTAAALKPTPASRRRQAWYTGSSRTTWSRQPSISELTTPARCDSCGASARHTHQESRGRCELYRTCHAARLGVL